MHPALFGCSCLIWVLLKDVELDEANAWRRESAWASRIDGAARINGGLGPPLECVVTGGERSPSPRRVLSITLLTDGSVCKWAALTGLESLPYQSAGNSHAHGTGECAGDA